MLHLFLLSKIRKDDLLMKVILQDMTMEGSPEELATFMQLYRQTKMQEVSLVEQIRKQMATLPAKKILGGI
ncbi:hypothetical protein D8Z77_22345 [Brevibacillus laterosporus]|nr:hypothetical protein D8Z77_22345 [Brevibacillus laterosporus]